MGRVVGEIAPERRGSHGFGFDPVMFIPSSARPLPNCPRSEERPQPPGRAAQQMLALMRERWL